MLHNNSLRQIVLLCLLLITALWMAAAQAKLKQVIAITENEWDSNQYHVFFDDDTFSSFSKSQYSFLTKLTWIEKPGGDQNLLNVNSISVPINYKANHGSRFIDLDVGDNSNFDIYSSNNNIIKPDKYLSNILNLLPQGVGSATITIKNRNSEIVVKTLDVTVYNPLGKLTWIEKPGGDQDLLNVNSISVPINYKANHGSRFIDLDVGDNSNLDIYSSNNNIIKPGKYLSNILNLLPGDAGSATITIKNRNSGIVVKTLDVTVYNPLGKLTWIEKPGGDQDLLNVNSISVPINYKANHGSRFIDLDVGDNSNLDIYSSNNNIIKPGNYLSNILNLLPQDLGSAAITIKDRNSGIVRKKLDVTVYNPLGKLIWIEKPGGDQDLLNVNSISVPTFSNFSKSEKQFLTGVLGNRSLKEWNNNIWPRNSGGSFKKVAATMVSIWSKDKILYFFNDGTAADFIISENKWAISPWLVKDLLDSWSLSGWPTDTTGQPKRVVAINRSEWDSNQYHFFFDDLTVSNYSISNKKFSTGEEGNRSLRDWKGDSWPKDANHTYKRVTAIVPNVFNPAENTYFFDDGTKSNFHIVNKQFTKNGTFATQWWDPGVGWPSYPLPITCSALTTPRVVAAIMPNPDNALTETAFWWGNGGSYSTWDDKAEKFVENYGADNRWLKGANAPVDAGGNVKKMVAIYPHTTNKNLTWWFWLDGTYSDFDNTTHRFTKNPPLTAWWTERGWPKNQLGHYRTPAAIMPDLNYPSTQTIFWWGDGGSHSMWDNQAEKFLAHYSANDPWLKNAGAPLRPDGKVKKMVAIYPHTTKKNLTWWFWSDGTYSDFDNTTHRFTKNPPLTAWWTERGWPCDKRLEAFDPNIHTVGEIRINPTLNADYPYPIYANGNMQVPVYVWVKISKNDQQQQQEFIKLSDIKTANGKSLITLYDADLDPEERQGAYLDIDGLGGPNFSKTWKISRTRNQFDNVISGYATPFTPSDIAPPPEEFDGWNRFVYYVTTTETAPIKTLCARVGVKGHYQDSCEGSKNESVRITSIAQKKRSFTDFIHVKTQPTGLKNIEHFIHKLTPKGFVVKSINANQGILSIMTSKDMSTIEHDPEKNSFVVGSFQSTTNKNSAAIYFISPNKGNKKFSFPAFFSNSPRMWFNSYDYITSNDGGIYLREFTSDGEITNPLDKNLTQSTVEFYDNYGNPGIINIRIKTVGNAISADIY